jgi:hypothetical protein
MFIHFYLFRLVLGVVFRTTICNTGGLAARVFRNRKWLESLEASIEITTPRKQAFAYLRKAAYWPIFFLNLS